MCEPIACRIDSSLKLFFRELFSSHMTMETILKQIKQTKLQNYREAYRKVSKKAARRQITIQKTEKLLHLSLHKN